MMMLKKVPGGSHVGVQTLLAGQTQMSVALVVDLSCFSDLSLRHQMRSFLVGP